MTWTYHDLMTAPAEVVEEIQDQMLKQVERADPDANPAPIGGRGWRG